MTEFFKPYEGKNPYLFISYSHRDSDKVIDTIRPIHDSMYRLWYDEGIPAGSDWPRNIAVHMNDCRTVLFFLSRTALDSPNCLSEITTAAKQGKPILLMKLEDIPEEAYPAKWQACLRNAKEIRYAPTPEERAALILECPLITDDFLGTKEEFADTGGGRGRRSPAATIAMIIASVLLIAALSGVAGLGTGLIRVFVTPSPEPTATPESTPTPVVTDTPSPTPTPEPTPEPTETPTPSISPEPDTNYKQSEGERNRNIEFTEALKQEERAVRRILDAQEDIQYRQLEEIEEIYFVGTMTPGTLKGVEIAADGTVTVNGPAVKTGSVSSLDLISLMPSLRKLALINQPVKDISGLSGITRLREVNLACSGVSSVSGLTNLPSLYSLNLAHTQVSDLRPLRDLPSLAEVTVSADMLPVTLDPEAGYDVILAE